MDEILQVQQVLAQAQQQLEELQGRLRYLDEHTSYSTITMAIYETGVVVTPPGEWGITKAFKDALHNLVGAVERDRSRTGGVDPGAGGTRQSSPMSCTGSGAAPFAVPPSKRTRQAGAAGQADIPTR